jgi:hypothetical protein
MQFLSLKVDMHLLHHYYNRFTDGVDVVSLTRRPSFTVQEDPSYSFRLREAESASGP